MRQPQVHGPYLLWAPTERTVHTQASLSHSGRPVLRVLTQPPSVVEPEALQAWHFMSFLKVRAHAGRIASCGVA